VSSTITADSFWQESAERWVRIIRQGHALRKLESALSGKTPGTLKDVITDSDIRIGDVLWQGSVGYCIAKSSAKRSPSEKVQILYLQKTSGTGQISASFAIPVRALLTDNFMTEAASAREILSQLLSGMAAIE
jgi:hypothetical protein